MRLKNFKDFVVDEAKKLTIYDKITDDPNEFVATEPNTFIDQDIEIDDIDRTKDAGNDVIRADRKNSKPKNRQRFNTSGQQRTLMR